jgi:cyclopropane fatty-acyl-phospholipid synthase-like methyltransferase|tara:strand:+ start:280 stop:849 length:570 start_codon:yes stop_codon:yes gene_type:complete
MKEEYYKTKESVEEYIRLSKDVSGKQLIEKLKRVLPSNSSLLEIGSGPGTDWKILGESYNIMGSDYSTEFLNHLRNKNPSNEFLELDAITLKTDKNFDGIYSNKVLHHLTDEELEESVKRQFKLLNADGVICHSFWRGEGFEIFKGLFVNYHTEVGLKKVFENYFEILSIDRYNEFEDDDSLLLIAKKK